MTLRGTGNGVRRRRAAGALSASMLLAVAACSGSAPGDETGPGVDAAPAGEPVVDNAPDVTVSDNVDKRGVPVDEKVRLTAEGGTLERIRVVGSNEEEGRHRINGRMSSDGTAWKATDLLEPNAAYKVRTVAVDSEGRKLRDTRTFRTDRLTLDEQTYPSVAPLEGETVGVGMPIIVTFDIPVTDRAAIERHLSVDAEPQVRGTWHWYSDTEVHFRPRKFWEPGSEVTVNADINSIDAGNGVYGQLDRRVTFDVGDSVVSKIAVDKHRMNVFINGRHARTIPISAGMKGYETRSGTKIIMEKFESKRMDAATTGVSRNDPEYYNIANVRWAMRVTYSGEFVHGAPWSVGAQGDANVSHGCVGMSLADAKWLFDRSRRGDVVHVRGTNREIEPGNGWTDWDVSYAEYKEGSALS